MFADSDKLISYIIMIYWQSHLYDTQSYTDLIIINHVTNHVAA